MTKEEFKNLLFKYNLTVLKFLELNDVWKSLSRDDKILLILEDDEVGETN